MEGLRRTKAEEADRSASEERASAFRRWVTARSLQAGTSGGSWGTVRAVLPVAAVLTGGLLWMAPRGAGQTAGVNQGGPEYVHAPAGMNPVPQEGSQGVSTMDPMRQADEHRRIVSDTAKFGGVKPFIEG